jgi:type I restriction enzyme S subunit
MQQLLTGQTRLPGFHGEWEVKRFGEGIALHSGHHVLAQHCNTQSEGVPYLTGPADFPEGRIRHTKFTTRPSTICSRGDILVTVKGSGSGTIVLADAAYCISRQLMAIRVSDWDARFIYYSLLQNAGQFRAASTGLIPGLSRSDILDQPLPLPPTTPEQTAIAEVLTEMDGELAVLEQRREKTRALKQAMMQELLTGKTRLL